MPKPRSSSSHTIARRVAPFAPIALALLMSRAVLGPPSGAPGGTTKTADLAPVTCGDVQDFEDCHTRFPAGCSQGSGTPNYDAYLNLLKNQLIAPASAAPVKFFTAKTDYDQLNKQIPAQLGSKNHADFKDALDAAGETQVYGVIGYLYYIKPEGAESSNCQLPKDPPNYEEVDYHIGIGFDKDLAGQLLGKKNPAPHDLSSNSVIVEMTPHFRARFESGKWTVNGLNNALGRQVKVVGQLMVDNDHNVKSQNCALATAASELASCWRMSVWELHPVISFLVCNKEPCTQNSPDWVELDHLTH